MAIADYSGLITKYAAKYNVDPRLVEAVIKTESSGNPNAASGTGPVGLMQVSKALAQDYGYSKDDRLDPEKNIDMGTRYLAQNLKAFNGDVGKALLGYNQGTGGARQMIAGKIPMAAEGKKYVTHPNYAPFVGKPLAGYPEVSNIANPVGALSNKPDNQFSPDLLNRNAALNAPTQADVQASQAIPITAEQAGALGAQQLQQQKQPEMDYGKPVLDLLSMLAARGPDKETVTGNTGVGRGYGSYNNDTKRVLQILSGIGAPTWM